MCRYENYVKISLPICSVSIYNSFFLHDVEIRFIIIIGKNFVNGFNLNVKIIKIGIRRCIYFIFERFINVDNARAIVDEERKRGLRTLVSVVIVPKRFQAIG